VSDGRVYVGGGFGSFDLYAFDAATGEPVWRARTTDDGPTGVVVEGEYLALNTESCTLEIRGKTTAGSSGGGGWGTR
jgi:outer membrane protein assembly factor BamB